MKTLRAWKKFLWFQKWTEVVKRDECEFRCKWSWSLLRALWCQWHHQSFHLKRKCLLYNIPLSQTISSTWNSFPSGFNSHEKPISSLAHQTMKQPKNFLLRNQSRQNEHARRWNFYWDCKTIKSYDEATCHLFSVQDDSCLETTSCVLIQLKFKLMQTNKQTNGFLSCSFKKQSTKRFWLKSFDWNWKVSRASEKRAATLAS